jgi:hypothetical protein
MDYIYDIVLNFQDQYYDFFEWKTTDKIINVKKILVYKTTDKDYLNLKYNEVTIDNKILPKQIKMFLLTNGKEVMGILLDSDGKVIKRSSLLFDESDEIIEDIDSIKILPLKYITNINKSHYSVSRINFEKTKYIEKYFDNIDITKDEYLLKYIYYDIYHKEENNIQKVYQELINLIKLNIEKLYNSINKVNIELKK